MRRYRTLDDLDVAGRRVLVRVDLNLPVDQDHRITDDTRLTRLTATLTELAERGARVIVMSHFGRPQGKFDDNLSLGHLALPLSQALGGIDIAVAADCIGPEAEQLAEEVAPGGFVLLENLRFHNGEEANDPAFARALARLGDIYVNDAFSASHRAHASIVGVPRLLPHCAGRLMQAELEALERALGNPERPVMAIVGGAKVSTKLQLLGHLIDKVETLALGGAMANSFVHAQGHNIGKSLCEPAMADTARAILTKAADQGCEILLPIDAVTAPAAAAGAAARTVPIDQVPDDAMILDIGPASADAIGNRLLGCKTVIWNGPLGAFESPPFDAHTTLVARTVARLTRAGLLTSVAGGGDTVAALALAGAEAGFSYVSTAGGAFLEWMEGKPLPGIEALEG